MSIRSCIVRSRVVSAGNLYLLHEILVGNHYYYCLGNDSADAAVLVVVVAFADLLIAVRMSMLLDDLYRSFEFEFRSLASP